MNAIGGQLENAAALNQVTVPDLWQQQAVTALRDGRDVVVHAPTGAGKTLIFELWSKQGKSRGQAIYTVPTRALANDKLAEWRARGWNVGIATGDLSDNLDAPVLVATLETQKHRLIQGRGPALLVVDEYQMLGDQDRGLNYELALALAPAPTQLLLLSGSVANPQDIVKWLRRLGRNAILIRHDQRPVPLEEVHERQLSYHLPSEIRGYWPRLVTKALADDLGPILIFAQRRQSAESMAIELARYVPTPYPLSLSPEQKALAGEDLAKLLKCRIAYHHSGLSYAARAGLVEPLAKAGQLRVVVATMGLAAGINFSLRTVALAGTSFRRDLVEEPIKPAEILQMFGRAGRRGLDETGYVLITANGVRLIEGHACQLARGGTVDWSAALGLMHAAAEADRDPFREAVRVQERLFTSKPILLGVEQALKQPNTPCGLKTDAERARQVRKRLREILNSRGEWEAYPGLKSVPVREVWMQARTPELGWKTDPSRRPAGTEPQRHPAESPHVGGRFGFGQTAGRFAGGGIPTPAGHSLADPRGIGSEASYPAAPSCEMGLLSEQAAPYGAPNPSAPERWPILSVPIALEEIGPGPLTLLSETAAGKVYGSAITVADVLANDHLFLTKWIRRSINWNGRDAPVSDWPEKIAPLVEKELAAQKLPVVRFKTLPQQIVAEVSLAEQTMRVPVDRYGIALWRPPEREVMPPECVRCAFVPVCQELSTATGIALLWRRLGLINSRGVPTRRGQIVSFFSQDDGLAVAAALEDTTYAIEELIYDLANLAAGFRFCGDENRWVGRLAAACQRIYHNQTIPGYLENGMPPKYGAGAEKVVANVHRNPLSKHSWVSELIGAGDIDRIIIEWRSVLRRIAHSPELDWSRWINLQSAARAMLNETESPTITELPPLEYHQTKRVDHRLKLRRH